MRPRLHRRAALAFAAVLVAAAAGGAYAVTSGSAAQETPAAAAHHGKSVFLRYHCGSCHTLAAARAKGKVGPSFDGSKMTIARIVAIVSRGKGAMPSFKGQLTKSDMLHLAEYIVQVRKKGTVKPGPQPEATTGPAVWAKAGCGSCHTLAAAGASGTNGPSLDESTKTVDEIIDLLTNGSDFGRMPLFKGKLTANEIRLVAEYVVQVRKG